MKIKENIKKFELGLGTKKLKKFRFILLIIFLITMMINNNVVYAADDPLAVINNLSNFIFGLIRAIGMIILAFSVVQIGLSIKSHDPSQRANGFLTFAGCVVITFAKEILNMITGG